MCLYLFGVQTILHTTHYMLLLGLSQDKTEMTVRGEFHAAQDGACFSLAKKVK